MATRSISPAAAEFEQFAAEQVASGEFSNAREVLEAAKAALARQKRYQEKLADLKQAIQEGMESGVAEGDVFARVREKAGLPPRIKT
ncbi:ribbon-helix-helix domain-containing protein [Granulicella paludicola]|uniref:ribbon-helix-helix domain-containing protein n=1 Tax=Granulicella paludicola TaxID=474951 RepID=UPI0021DFC935|nr:type II toxin-antitoxin system ParD family antitoxin [Granulicella paludicola]